MSCSCRFLSLSRLQLPRHYWLPLVFAVTARAAKMTHPRTAYFVRRWFHLCNKLYWRRRVRYMFGWSANAKYWAKLKGRMRDSTYFLANARRDRSGQRDVLKDWERVLWACVRFTQQKTSMNVCSHLLQEVLKLQEQVRDANGNRVKPRVIAWPLD